MKKIYEKSQLYFALIWSGVYVVLMSAADSVSETIGTAKIVTAPVCIGLVLAMYLWIRKNGLKEKYGLCPFQGSAKQYLFFIPLVLLASTNLWWGVRMNYSPAETALYVVSMLCVGFLEEVIFRGLLFTAIAKNNIRSAVVISSVTFGIGHLINLFNGSGMDLVSNLCQIVFAIAVGFLLVTIFDRGGSLLPCIIVHAAINTFGTFANDADLTTEMHLLHLAVLIVITVAYTLILTRTLPERQQEHTKDGF